MEKILWVGIGFDPDEDGGNEYVRKQNLIITKTMAEMELFSKVHSSTILIGSGEFITVPSTIGPIIDFHQHDRRMGFGISVTDIREGRRKMVDVTAWLRSSGITLPVSIWEWTPGQRIARHAGLDQLLSLDFA